MKCRVGAETESHSQSYAKALMSSWMRSFPNRSRSVIAVGNSIHRSGVGVFIHLYLHSHTDTDTYIHHPDTTSPCSRQLTQQYKPPRHAMHFSLPDCLCVQPHHSPTPRTSNTIASRSFSRHQVTISPTSITCGFHTFPLPAAMPSTSEGNTISTFDGL